MPDAVIRALITSSSVFPHFSPTEISTAGTMPQEPAVGMAQIFPMAAFTSLQDKALAITVFMNPPHKVSPDWEYRY
jgi:hypothetical protein